MKEKESKILRFGVCDVLLIVFIVLKLTGVINWSWWIVTLPITIPIGIVLFIAIIVGLFGIAEESKKNRH